jgi:dsRNA-specific ribonuclease
MEEKDPRRFWWTYFPAINGKLPTVYDGWNFDKTTLSYMTTASRAAEIAVAIVHKMTGYPIMVMEPCGGIGGNTIAFVREPKISKVITFEQVDERYAMLQRNVSIYDHDNKALLYNVKFEHNILDKVVLYFDPPWLDDDIPAAVKYPKDYYLKPADLKVANMTLDDYLLDKTIQDVTPMMVWRLPPTFVSYKAPTKFWQITVDKHTKDGEVQFVTLFCVNKNIAKIMKSADPEIPDFEYEREVVPTDLVPAETTWPSKSPPTPATAKPVTPATAKPPAKSSSAIPGITRKQTTELATDKVVKRDVYVAIDGTYLTKLYTGQEYKEWETDVDTWRRGLLKYVVSLVAGLLLLDDSDAKRFVDDDAKKSVWYRVFTHESVDSKVSGNYENIETIGDAVMDLNFKKFLFRTNPDITEGLLSEFTSRYLESRALNFLAGQLKITRWCRNKDSKKTESALGEDLIESFFGAIDIVGDMIRDGFGSCCAYNLIHTIYEKHRFDYTMATGTAKTTIIQMFGSKLHLNKQQTDKFESISTTAVGNTTVSIYLPGPWLEFYKDHGHEIANPVGVGTAAEKDTAITAAWNEALANMNRHGITLEWAAELENISTLSALTSDIQTAVRLKANTASYTDIRFVVKDGALQLVGFKEDRTRRVLKLAPLSTGSIPDLKRKIADAYLSY